MCLMVNLVRPRRSDSRPIESYGGLWPHSMPLDLRSNSTFGILHFITSNNVQKHVRILRLYNRIDAIPFCISNELLCSQLRTFAYLPGNCLRVVPAMSISLPFCGQYTCLKTFPPCTNCVALHMLDETSVTKVHLPWSAMAQ